MNSWNGVGRLVGDPKLRNSGSTVVCNFTIACSSRQKDKDGAYKTNFIPCTAFNKKAEFIAKYFKKGNRIGITNGEITTGSYEKNGEKVYTWGVNVNDAEFVESKTTNTTQQDSKQNFVDVPDYADDSGLPFN